MILIFSNTFKYFLLWNFHFYLCYTITDRSLVIGENEERKCCTFSNLRIQPSENESEFFYWSPTNIHKLCIDFLAKIRIFILK